MIVGDIIYKSRPLVAGRYSLIHAVLRVIRGSLIRTMFGCLRGSCQVDARLVQAFLEGGVYLV